MSEEQAEGLQSEQEVEQVEQVEQAQEEQTQSKPTAEDVARQGGWKPLEGFEGEPAEWGSAEE